LSFKRKKVFIEFFYDLRNAGVPVTPTSFLRLQKALYMGMVCSLEDFYVVARSLMVKSERYFDLYDRTFSKYFHGIEKPEEFERELEDTIRALLKEWLKDPKQLADLFGIDPNSIPKLSLEELVKYFIDRLKEQTERHDGGDKWIGTGGRSPVGHSGYNPYGMRVGGRSMGKSAVKIAMERRYRDYSQDQRLTAGQVGEALKRLKNLKPSGPRDMINVEKTINETVKNGGEIELIFDRSLRDKLRVILMIDNGGWSMDPYIDVVQTLFNYSQATFKDLKVFYFHNCIYDQVWEDPPRLRKPLQIEDFSRLDPDTRLIIVGDAAMAPSELESPNGSIYYYETIRRPGIERLRLLAKIFRHSAWLNPMVEYAPDFNHGVYTVKKISNIFRMFALSLDGLEKAASRLLEKN